MADDSSLPHAGSTLIEAPRPTPFRGFCNNQLGNCRKNPSAICSRCSLAQYCSRECQKEDHPRHRRDCKNAMLNDPQIRERKVVDPRPYNEKHDNRFLKPLWGMSPPRDILNLEKNEGLDYQKDLSLLFAFTTDLRNVMNTVIGIPETYTGTCSIVINHPDADLSLRNLIILLLVLEVERSGNSCPFDSNEDIALHTWYSAFLSPKMEKVVKSYSRRIITPLLEERLGGPKIQNFGQTWEIGNVQVQVNIGDEELEYMNIQLSGSEGMDFELAKSRRDLVMKTETEHLMMERDQMLSTSPPAHRLVYKQWRDSGVLLPYGTLSYNFEAPNPTFFRNGDWLQCPLSKPVDGADLQGLYMVSKKYKLPENDVHNALYQERRDMMDAFRKRVKLLKIDFQLFCLPEHDLLDWFEVIQQENDTVAPDAYGFFDRIDITLDLGNSKFEGRSVELFRRLLRPSNQYATMVHVMGMSQFALQSLHKLAGDSVLDLLPYRWGYQKIRVAAITPGVISKLRILAMEREQKLHHMAFEDRVFRLRKSVNSRIFDVQVEDAIALTVLKPWKQKISGLCVNELVDETLFILRYAAHSSYASRHIEWRRVGADHFMDAIKEHEVNKVDESIGDCRERSTCIVDLVAEKASSALEAERAAAAIIEEEEASLRELEAKRVKKQRKKQNAKANKENKRRRKGEKVDNGGEDPSAASKTGEFPTSLREDSHDGSTVHAATVHRESPAEKFEAAKVLREFSITSRTTSSEKYPSETIHATPSVEADSGTLTASKGLKDMMLGTTATAMRRQDKLSLGVKLHDNCIRVTVVEVATSLDEVQVDGLQVHNPSSEAAEGDQISPEHDWEPDDYFIASDREEVHTNSDPSFMSRFMYNDPSGRCCCTLQFGEADTNALYRFSGQLRKLAVV